MNLRIVVSVVFVGSLAYACGPSTHADAAVERPVVAQQGFALASMSGSTRSLLRSSSTREKILKSGSSALTTKFDVAQRNDGVAFALRVTNATAKRVEVTFPSGQTYDFVVVDSVGREVWRWAQGRIFTQSVQNKLLGKGEGISINETWSPAKPGKYTAIAMLHSTNFPIQKMVEFERK